MNESGASSRIRIAVRVRPLNAQELSSGHVSVIERINDNGVRLWDPTTLEVGIVPDISAASGVWSRDFFYDHCLWSVSSDDANYADQSVRRSAPHFLL